MPVALLFGGSAVLWKAVSVDASNAAAHSAPQPPRNLRAVPAPNGIYLEWDPSPTPPRQVADYRVERFRSGDSTAYVVQTQQTLSWLDTSAVGGLQYRYRVQARDWFLAESGWSAPAFGLFRDSVSPPAPDSVALTVNPNGLFVSWAPVRVRDLAEYLVMRSSEGSPFEALARTEAPQYLDTLAAEAVAYRYALVAVDYSGNHSAPSDTVAGIIPDGRPPGRVAAFVARGLAEGNLLEWVPPDDTDLAGFRIGRSRDPRLSNPIAELPAGASSYLDTTAAERTFYVYRIVALDRSGNVGEARFADALRPDATAPAAPGALSTEQQGGAVLVSWSPSPSPDVASYTVYTRSLVDSLERNTVLPRDASRLLLTPFGAGIPTAFHVTATDSAGNESEAAEPVLDAVVPRGLWRSLPGIPIGRPGGFRLVSVPGAPTPEWRFEGARGRDWEVLDPVTLGPGDWPPPSGRPVWAWSRLPAVAPADSGRQVIQEGYEVTLPVHSGWNFLANPFDVSLDWELVRRWNGVSGPLLGFEDRWHPVRDFKPYSGYAWYNAGDVSSLRLPYAVGRVEFSPELESAADIEVRLDSGVTLAVGIGLPGSAPIGHPPVPAGTPALRLVPPRADAHGNAALIRRSVPGCVVAGECPGGVHEVTLELVGYAGVIEMRAAALPPGWTLVLRDFQGVRWTLSDEPTRLLVTGPTVWTLEIGSTESPAHRIPGRMGISHAFPNPVREVWTMAVDLPEDGPLVVEFVDLLGRSTSRLIDAYLPAGRHGFTLTRPRDLAAGLYVLSARSGAVSDSRIVVLLD